MKEFAICACLALAAAPACALAVSLDTNLHPVQAGGHEVIFGGGVGAAKAARDTVLIIGPNGSGAPVIGTFQTAGGNPDWNGFTHYDITQRTTERWHASTYYAVSGTYSAWCGENLLSCGAGDVAGGYANLYNEMLEWRGAVADNGQGCTVTVAAALRHDTEPGYDFTYLSCEKADAGIVDLASWDGAGLEAVDLSVSYAPADYLGAGADEVVVLFRVTSDGGWSDGDCAYPSHGACQLDDVVITLTNGTGYATDFEDGTLGAFTVRFPVGVGDFAKLWTGLADVDDCHTNWTPQAAFIDDGVVVPGTGGSPCVNWCYGPGGFIVTTTGGLAGPDDHIHDAVESPVCAWPDQALDGASLAFDVYQHEDLSADAPGMFYTWGIRSAGPGEDITADLWSDRNFVYFGPAGYLRNGSAHCGDLLRSDRTQVQVQMAAYELGWVWGWVGNDGYPAPYFDNIRLAAYASIGPGMTAREIDLAQDNFPEIGIVDLVNLGANCVRFDMASNIAPISNQQNSPGDSIVFDAVVTRDGAAMTGNPRLYYRLFANPVFDAYRTSGLPNAGSVPCDTLRNAAGLVVPGRWAADLPDSGFFFPGDVIHYFFEASDALAGDVQTALLPADTTGFSSRDNYGMPQYSPSFTVRALPSINGNLEQPWVLFWNDFADRGGRDEWYTAFTEIGFRLGRDYDVYYTNGPSSGVGDGLGGRATAQQLAGYHDLLYTCGDLGVNTIANGDFNSDPSNDAEVLDLWLRSGGKDFFATGDNLASDLAQSGTVTSAFLADQMGISVASDDIRPLIGMQASPRVLSTPSNPVFATVSSWIGYGGCPGINTFDAVVPLTGAVPLAEFADASGAPGGYTYSAATLNAPAWGARVISLPYDFMSVYTDPDEATKSNASLSARYRMLRDVLNYLGIGGGEGSAAPPAAPALALRCAPNPCNPRTLVSFTAPQAGRLVLQLYDIRGRLVRTLADGPVAAGPNAVPWDGTDDRGAAVASGVYFAQARFGADTLVEKVTLLK